VTVIIVGGRGNKLGVLLGALIVPAFGEASQFLPNSSSALFSGAIQWMFVGVLLLVFLWWRPRGILPERKRSFPVPAAVLSSAAGSPPHTGWRAGAETAEGGVL